MANKKVYVYNQTIENHSEYIKQLEKLLKSNNLPTDGLECTFNDLLLLDVHNKIVGGIGLEIYGENALMRSLVVDKSYRGNGYGKLLINKILERAKSQGVRDIYLLTETAAPLFAKLGFEKYPRNNVPKTIASTKEFAKLCPDSAVSMHLTLI